MKGQDSNNNITDIEPSTSHALPTMPMKKKRNYNSVVVYDSSSHDSNSIDTSADKDSSDSEDNTEDTSLKAEIEQEIEKLRAQTPILTPLIGCSTKLANNTAQPDRVRTKV